MFGEEWPPAADTWEEYQAHFKDIFDKYEEYMFAKPYNIEDTIKE